MPRLHARQDDLKRREPETLPCGLCSLEPLCFPEGSIAGKPVAAPVRRNLMAGQHLLYAGQVCRGLQVLRTGSVRGYTLSRDGGERTTEIYLPGEPIGLDAFGDWHQRDYLVALEPSTYCEVPLPRVRRLMSERREIREAVPFLLGGALGATRERLLALRRGPARAQLAAFLLDLSRRRARRGLPGERFRLSMDRQDIASFLGLTMETVSRSLGQLQRAGVVQVSGKQLSILEPDTLRVEAEGDPPA